MRVRLVLPIVDAMTAAAACHRATYQDVPGAFSPRVAEVARRAETSSGTRAGGRAQCRGEGVWRGRPFA